MISFHYYRSTFHASRFDMTGLASWSVHPLPGSVVLVIRLLSSDPSSLTGPSTARDSDREPLRLGRPMFRLSDQDLRLHFCDCVSSKARLRRYDEHFLRSSRVIGSRIRRHSGIACPHEHAIPGVPSIAYPGELRISRAIDRLSA